MFQVQDQSQRPLTTAHLAQTMSLLLLSNMELRDTVMAELSSNPALELVEETVCPNCQRRLNTTGPCPACSIQHQEEDPIVFLSPRDSYRPSRSQKLEEQPPDQEPAAPEDLTTHVLQQLASDLHPDDRKLAIYILSSLDEDGFLQDPPAIIARTTRTSFFKVESVLKLISHVDPPGLATTGPKQALLAQLDMLPENGSILSLARQIIEGYFTELGRREIEKIAEGLEISPSRVRQAAAFIHDNLNPYPGRGFWGSGRGPQSGNPNVYHSPDILISHNPSDTKGPLVVEIFSAVAGWLRVNPMFSKARTRTNGDQTEEWSKYIERASLFVKCLQQRNNTMRRLLQTLVTRQRDFIMNGDRYLKPMTRAKIADEIGVHESTISRAVAHKSIALPDGRIIPLARFFDRSLAVRDRIKEIVKNEKRPLTDDQIADILKDEGIKIARRTVAKYRSIENILPARLRHRNGARNGEQV
jgi:RNA polymerase sigma-54 factor